MNRNRDCRRPTRRRRRIRPKPLKAAARAATRPRSLRRRQGLARYLRSMLRFLGSPVETIVKKPFYLTRGAVTGIDAFTQ